MKKIICPAILLVLWHYLAHLAFSGAVRSAANVRTNHLRGVSEARANDVKLGRLRRETERVPYDLIRKLAGINDDAQLPRQSIPTIVALLGAAGDARSVVATQDEQCKSKTASYDPTSFNTRSQKQESVLSYLNNFKTPTIRAGSSADTVLKLKGAAVRKIALSGQVIRPNSRHEDDFNAAVREMCRNNNRGVYFCPDLWKFGAAAHMCDRYNQYEVGQCEGGVRVVDHDNLSKPNLAVLDDLRAEEYKLLSSTLPVKVEQLKDISVPQVVAWEQKHGISFHYFLVLHMLVNSDDCSIFDGAARKRGLKPWSDILTLESGSQVEMSALSKSGDAHEAISSDINTWVKQDLDIVVADVDLFVEKLARLGQVPPEDVRKHFRFHHLADSSSWEPLYNLDMVAVTPSLFNQIHGPNSKGEAGKVPSSCALESNTSWYDPFTTTTPPDALFNTEGLMHEAGTVRQRHDWHIDATQKPFGDAGVDICFTSMDTCDSTAYLRTSGDLHAKVTERGFVEFHRFSGLTAYYREDPTVCQLSILFVMEPEYFALESRPFGGRRISDEDLEKGAAAATRHAWRDRVYNTVFRSNQKDTTMYFFGNAVSAFGFNSYLQKSFHQDSQLAVMGGKAVLLGRNDDVQPMADKYRLDTESINKRERNAMGKAKRRAVSGVEKAFDKGENPHARDNILGLLSWDEELDEEQSMKAIVNVIKETAVPAKKFLDAETKRVLKTPFFVANSDSWQEVRAGWEADEQSATKKRKRSRFAKQREVIAKHG